MPNAKIDGVEIPVRYIDIVAVGAGRVEIAGLLSPREPSIKMLRRLQKKEPADFVEFEVKDNQGNEFGGIAEVVLADVEDQPAGHRFLVLLHKQ